MREEKILATINKKDKFKFRLVTLEDKTHTSDGQLSVLEYRTDNFRVLGRFFFFSLKRDYIFAFFVLRAAALKRTELLRRKPEKRKQYLIFCFNQNSYISNNN